LGYIKIAIQSLAGLKISGSGTTMATDNKIMAYGLKGNIFYDKSWDLFCWVVHLKELLAVGVWGWEIEVSEKPNEDINGCHNQELPGGNLFHSSNI
jgi:hypothetical protein